MLGASLIVFRETLEAALLIGIIAAATRNLDRRNRWLGIGISVGVFGALLVAALTESIAMMAEGSGQEIFNSAILGIAVLMIGWHIVWMASHGKEMADKARLVGSDVSTGKKELSAIAILVAMAVLREGAETALFLHGMAASGNGTTGVLSGGALGLTAGCAVGWLIYAGLLRIPAKWFFSFTNGLLLLLAAGLASQMARFLIQADFLPSIADSVWDSSHLLSMSSVFGKAMHVLIGYEAQPSGMQLIFYVSTLLSIGLAAIWARRQTAII